MKQQSQIIKHRMLEIDELKKALEKEHAMLFRFSNLLGHSEYLVREKDVFSTRTALKFEMLARVAEYLNKPDMYGYGGASTKDIYQAVISEVDKENHQIDYSKVDPDREEGEPPEVGTPMTAAKESINYNTFRSYLARFKEEGRIFYNSNSKRWRITKDEVTTGKTYDDEEDDYRDLYAD